MSQRAPETTFPIPRNHAETDSAQSLAIARGDFKMLALKFAALALAAGTLITMYSPDFSGDLLLAIVSCLS